MKTLTAALLAALTVQTYATTELSQLVNYVQSTYAAKYKDHPILVFDIDELEYRYAKAGVFGKGKELEKKRSAIIQQYVKEEIGIELADNEAMSYEPYTTVLKGGAYALPTLDRSGGWGEVAYKMCAVFPATANSNQRLETERITGLKTPGAYENITYEGLQEKLTYKEMQLFSLYHELGHCMDRDFMPDNYAAYEVSPHDVHESESYAEVFALLMLEREGVTGTARTRALLRNMYTQEMGKWFINNPQNGFGNPLYLKGGLIYYLSPPLLAAGEFLKRNRDELLQGPIDGLLAKAKEFVDDYALEGRSFHLIFRALSEDAEEIIADYRESSTDNPSFFFGPYKDMLHFLDYSPYLFTLIVGDTPDVNEGAELEGLKPQEFCSLEKGQVFDYLALKRQELREEGLSYASQQQRQEELNSFFESYANCQ